MAIFLIRHAKAGDRERWDGADSRRPLTTAGRRQASLLAERFTTVAVPAVLSSPYLRCVETVTPLAEQRGRRVDIEPRLSEGRSFLEVVDLLDTVADGTVLCSHGDVIPEVVEALLRRGAELLTPPDHRKCVTWVLERDGERISRISALPPPDPSP